MARRVTTTSLAALLDAEPLDWDALCASLRAMPADVDPELGARAASTLLGPGSCFWFARTCRALPVPVIRALVARLQGGPKDAVTLYLLEAVRVGDDELPTRWAQAVEGLNDLQTSYAWGSKQRRAKIQALAKGPLLPLVQAASVGADEPFGDMLAVLAADGSDASVDALMPHFTRAHEESSAMLDRLRRLETHAAATPEMRAMFTAVEERLALRNAQSPALAFAHRLGLDVASFAIRLSISSAELNRSRQRGGVPTYQSHVVLDSTAADWFHVSVALVPGDFSDHSSTWFGSNGRTGDQLGLGQCSAEALPGWYARAAKKLRIRWNWAQVSVYSSLRGKKRQRVVEWIASGRGEQMLRGRSSPRASRPSAPSAPPQAEHLSGQGRPDAS